MDRLKTWAYSAMSRVMYGNRRGSVVENGLWILFIGLILFGLYTFLKGTFLPEITNRLRDWISQ